MMKHTIPFMADGLGEHGWKENTALLLYDNNEHEKKKYNDENTYYTNSEQEQEQQKQEQAQEQERKHLDNQSQHCYLVRSTNDKRTLEIRVGIDPFEEINNMDKDERTGQKQEEQWEVIMIISPFNNNNKVDSREFAQSWTRAIQNNYTIQNAIEIGINNAQKHKLEISCTTSDSHIVNMIHRSLHLSH